MSKQTISKALYDAKVQELIFWQEQSRNLQNQLNTYMVLYSRALEQLAGKHKVRVDIKKEFEVAREMMRRSQLIQPEDVMALVAMNRETLAGAQVRGPALQGVGNASADGGYLPSGFSKLSHHD